MNQSKKLVKFLKGMAKTLEQLAIEIDDAGEFDKESEELLSKIGSNLLFEAKAYSYRDSSSN